MEDIHLSLMSLFIINLMPRHASRCMVFIYTW